MCKVQGTGEFQAYKNLGDSITAAREGYELRSGLPYLKLIEE
jgi:hypothetical protein